MAKSVATLNRRSGRPRSEASRHAVLAATKKLLRTMTVRDLSIERVAKQAGVGKSTIYRWWPNKAALVIDAFFDGIVPLTPFPKSTSAANSIAKQVSRLVKALSGKQGRIVAQIVAEGQADPSVLENFRSVFLAHRRAAARKVIERGVAIGEFDSNVDIELAIDLIYGPIYFRLLVGHCALDRQFADDLPQLALKAIKADVNSS